MVKMGHDGTVTPVQAPLEGLGHFHPGAEVKLGGEGRKDTAK